MIELIKRRYYYFKYIDIEYVFDQAKMGNYGHLYKSLDAITVMSWFAKHDEERWKIMQEIGLDKHDKLKKKNGVEGSRKRAQ